MSEQRITVNKGTMCDGDGNTFSRLLGRHTAGGFRCHGCPRCTSRVQEKGECEACGFSKDHTFTRDGKLKVFDCRFEWSE